MTLLISVDLFPPCLIFPRYADGAEAVEAAESEALKAKLRSLLRAEARGGEAN